MIFGTGNAFGKQMNILERALDTSVIRREVIADNIANADTPGFKRSEVSFESQMRRAIKSEQNPEFPTLMTDKRDFSFNDFIDYRKVKPKITVEYDTSYRNDKNNVDIEKEMILATKNAMHYNAMMEVYNRNIKMLDIVMR